jgi:hypothetical protein
MNGKSILFPALFFVACSGPAPVLKISGGEGGRGKPVVECPLPASAKAGENYVLRNKDTGARLFAQRRGDDRLVFILDDPLPAESIREYAVRKMKKKTAHGPKLEEANGKLTVSIAGKPVLTYHTAVVPPPEGEPAYYRRGGFIHPVYSPSGVELTDDFPVGHAHQHGLFMAWVSTVFRGDTIDFWNQHKEQGTVEPVAVEMKEEGPVLARFTATLRHVSFKHGPVLNETWTVTVYNLESPYIFDIESVQTCATEDTLYLLPYIYGGMAFRGSREWNASDSLHYGAPMQVLTDEGKSRAESNHTRPRWLAAFGTVSGKTAGIALLDHPDNFRYPQPARVHPEMPYFCKAPMVGEGFEIAPGKAYISRYRFVVFDGEVEEDGVMGILNIGY